MIGNEESDENIKKSKDLELYAYTEYISFIIVITSRPREHEDTFRQSRGIRYNTERSKSELMGVPQQWT